MNIACLVVLSALAVTVYSTCLEADVPYKWNYDDTEEWKEMYPDCAEQNQSPIDLHGEECEDSKQPVVSINTDRQQEPAVLWNDGRSLKLKFDCFGEKGPLTLRFRNNLPDSYDDSEDLDYDLAELHFHWGKKGKKGSEHAIEGERSEAEAHFKFKHPEHSTLESAKREKGKLYAVGVLLTAKDEEEDSDSDIWFPTFGLEKTMNEVSKFNDIHRITVNIRRLKRLLDRVLQSVYKYTGSLTTPPCTPDLPWLVSKVKTPVSHKFLKGLRKKLFDEHGQKIVNNFRPIQDLDERHVCLHEGEENGYNGKGSKGNGIEGYYTSAQSTSGGSG